MGWLESATDAELELAYAELNNEVDSSYSRLEEVRAEESSLLTQISTNESKLADMFCILQERQVELDQIDFDDITDELYPV